MSITLDMTDVDPIIAHYRDAPAEVQARLGQLVEDCAVLYERSVISNTPIGATEKLHSSITHRALSPTMLDVYSTDVPIKVASVETGRAPGRRPPIAPIELWVRVKLGITDDREARSVAFLIARAIGRRGTEGAHMFADGASEGEDAVQARIDAFLSELAGWL